MNSRSLRAAFTAMSQAQAEQHLLEDLRGLRKSKPELFIRSVHKIAKSLPDGRPFIKQLDLTDEEFKRLILEDIRNGGMTATEAFELLGIEPEPEPTGLELLTAAINKLRQENPTRKLHRLKQNVVRHIDKHFAQQPKPFDNKDVEVGARWFNQERKKIKEEKDASDPRSRSRASVPVERWAELCLSRFNNPRPDFIEQFRKEVRAKAREMQNDKSAQTLAN